MERKELVIALAKHLENCTVGDRGYKAGIFYAKAHNLVMVFYSMHGYGEYRISTEGFDSRDIDVDSTDYTGAEVGFLNGKLFYMGERPFWNGCHIDLYDIKGFFNDYGLKYVCHRLRTRYINNGTPYFEIDVVGETFAINDGRRKNIGLVMDINDLMEEKC